MSMQEHLPDQAVRADFWTLFCPKCSQKMRIEDGDAGPEWQGNARLRVRLRPHRKD